MSVDGLSPENGSAGRRTITVVVLHSDDSRTAPRAVVIVRRAMLVVISAALIIVGAATADHVEVAGSPDHRQAVSVSATTPITEGLDVTQAPAELDDPTTWAVGADVLLTCSVLGLLVLVLHAARSTPVAGTVHTIASTIVAPAVGTAHSWPDVVRPDRGALCVIRT